jgi:hypothetical protein
MRYEPHMTIDFGTGVSGPNPAVGNCLEVSGDFLFAGDQGHSTRNGRVFIFKRNGDGWVEHQQIFKGNGLGGSAWFGYCLDVSGDWLCVSCTHQTGWASPVGAEGGVEMFQHNPANDQWEWRQSIIGYDSGPTDEFGLCVMVSGNWMIVGSPYRDTPQENCGKIYFYELVDGEWIFRQEFLETTVAAQNTFGLCVEIDGEWAFSHSYGMSEGQGRVLVYRLTGGTWVLHQTLLASAPVNAGAFGRPMRCDGKYLICGQTMRGSSLNSGSSTVFFERNHLDQWVQTGIHYPPMLLNQAWFPSNIALSGKYAVAASLFADRSIHRTSELDPQINGQNGDGKGRTILYERQVDGSYAAFPIPLENLQYNDWSGSSVAVEPDGSYVYSLAFGTNVRSTMRLHIWKRRAGAHYATANLSSLIVP